MTFSKAYIQSIQLVIPLQTIWNWLFYLLFTWRETCSSSYLCL